MVVSIMSKNRSLLRRRIVGHGWVTERHYLPSYAKITRDDACGYGGGLIPVILAGESKG